MPGTGGNPAPGLRKGITVLAFFSWLLNILQLWNLIDTILGLFGLGDDTE